MDGGNGIDAIVLAATSADLDDALDTDIINVEAISAESAASGVVIDLGNQSDGFRITGSANSDTITASLGEDTFVYTVSNSGDDTIDGFTEGAGANHDFFEFSTTIFADYNAVLAAMTQQGLDVVIDSGSDTITIKDALKANLLPDNFLFVP